MNGNIIIFSMWLTFLLNPWDDTDAWCIWIYVFHSLTLEAVLQS